MSFAAAIQMIKFSTRDHQSVEVPLFQRPVASNEGIVYDYLAHRSDYNDASRQEVSRKTPPCSSNNNNNHRQLRCQQIQLQIAAVRNIIVQTRHHQVSIIEMAS